ncbi:cytochrome P450 [Prauserella muralis]|uniref:Cytochrome n=1 Tax=Prauserella muralis TaxID=588067 RepID=A0A2V4BDC0_9PSEU|nr:cytochrome P450 [Prauserella muralis]PXY32502.1 cytochrome [Prauserella muralis]TWE23793.1 cytochrome P450 [Prauserella muralis]
MTDAQLTHTGAVRLYGPEFQQDPAGLYARIKREYGPVAPVLLDGDLPAWFVCGYREVHQVTSDSQLFARDTRRWNQWDNVPADWPQLGFVAYNPSLMFTEGDEHRRRAGAVSDALAEVDQFELRTLAEQAGDRLIDTFAGTGEADLMEQYASTIPLLVTAGMYGMPEADIPSLVRDITLSVNADAESAAAHQRVAEAMARLVELKHRQPGEDVPTRLIEHPSGLTDEEILLDLVVIIAAAHQPTSYWIGNTIRLMLTDDRFATTLAGGRASVGQALNEVLWQDTPTQNFIGRFATRDTQVGGQRVRAGDLLILGLAAANADPQLHSCGGAAGNHAQMSFGHGEHGCPWPAPELAEVIAKAAVEVLLDRLPDLTLAVHPEQLRWQPSVWMRGLVSLPVTFTPAYVPLGGR